MPDRTDVTAPPIPEHQPHPPRRRRHALFAAVLLLGLPLGGLLMVEGGASLLLLARDAAAALKPARVEGTNTEYHPELGWVGKRSFAAPDMYGPGIALHTNSRGFRGRAQVSDAVAGGKYRIVCSGDSFTLGHSVADDETWCARLAEDGVESVNMGQIGYGIDQAYLWYKRDGHPLQHHLHIFAFVTDDFHRMTVDRFLGYAKPVLAVEGDSLVVRGVPTPQRAGELRATRLRRAVQQLRVAEFLSRLGDGPRQAPGGDQPDPAALRPVLAHVLADLARINAAKESRLLVVYLPIQRDFGNDEARPWRDIMRELTDSLKIDYLDLIPELRKLEPGAVAQLYVQNTAAEGMGHFSVRGNEWAAGHIRAAARARGALAAHADSGATSR